MSNFLARREKRTVQCVSGKAGIKILCALLSLPIPPEVAKPLGEEVANTVNGVLTNFLLHKTLNKLLLVGCKFPRDLIHSSIQCAYFSQRLGLALGAAVMDKKSARILGLVIMLSFLLARGYYIQHVPAFNAWIKYYLQHVPALLIKKKTCSGIHRMGLHGQAISLVALAVMFFGYKLVACIARMRIGVTQK